MGFSTRDRYRHVVEEIAKKSGLAEDEVARVAIGLAGKATPEQTVMTGQGTWVSTSSTGGCRSSKPASGRRSSFVDMVRGTGRRFALLLYLGSILLTCAGFCRRRGRRDRLPRLARPATCGSSAYCSLFSVSSLAIALVNLFTTRLVTPRPLPRMDFSKGIPPESSTLVVVPTMLTSPEHIGHLADALEVRFLANRDDNLRFGLLTDFRDAPEEKLTGDEALLLLARQGIEALNDKVQGPGRRSFLPVSSPPSMEPAGANLDGLREEAGETRGAERPSSRGVTAADSRSSSAIRQIC